MVTSPVSHFSNMARVTLIHPQQRVEVSGRALVQKSDLFADDLTLVNSSYTVQSRVSLGAFQDFVAALEDKPVTITNDNLSGLSRLCDEFRFRDLGTRLSQFRPQETRTISGRGNARQIDIPFVGMEEL
jgi:hypothetical protein